MDKKIIEFFNLLQKRVENIDLSDRISLKIEKLENPKFINQKKLAFFIKTAIASVVVIAVVFIFNPFKKNSKLLNENIVKEDIQKMSLQYAQMFGKEAKRYYFKSDNSNRLIVWIQKKGE